MKLSTLRTTLFALLVLSSAAAGRPSQEAAATARQAQPVEGDVGGHDPYFPGLGNGGYDVQHYDVDLKVELFSEQLTAEVRITAVALVDLVSFSLDLYGLEVTAVEVDGIAAGFERAGASEGKDAEEGEGEATPASELIVRPAMPLRAEATFEVTVRYHGWPQGRYDPSVRFMPVGWLPREEAVYVVSECIGASSWLPCNDHPSDKATFAYRVTVEKPYSVAANGLLVEEIDLGEKRTFVWKARDPMATYLATVNVAEFDVYEDEGPRGIPIRVYYPKGAEEQARPFHQQAEVLRVLENAFGPYPFEAAGGVVANTQMGGALECQTMPVYGPGMGVEVIVHELAHQWYGDAVSPELWRDMWLNEGFASYSEYLWIEAKEGKEAYEERAKRSYERLRRSATGSPFDPGVEQVFSGRVYTRGAMVLYGLRAEVGDEAFFRILKSWVETHRNGNGSTAQFVAHATRIAERDLAAFFDAWLYSEITPVVEAWGAIEPQPRGERRGRGRRRSGGEQGAPRDE
jgi:aminopeptidase N